MCPSFFAAQNFAANLVAAQFNSRLRNSDESLTSLGVLFERLNLAFSLAFLIEILVNLFANWYRRFFRDAWNIVDAACILLSLGAIAQSHWTALRFMRTVRVVRLFGKFKEMRRMLRSLAACITQMGCAFFILMVLASICEAQTLRFSFRSEPALFVQAPLSPVIFHPTPQPVTLPLPSGSTTTFAPSLRPS